MRELDEDLIKVVWMRVTSEPPEVTLAIMKQFSQDQVPLFKWLTTGMGETVSEKAVETILYLGTTIHEVIAWREYPRGPHKVALVDDVMIQRHSAKREASVGAFLKGKQAQAEPLANALEMLVERFDLPQLSLLGHAAEALLVAHEEEDLSREEAEKAFVKLLVLLDALDRVVKS